MPIDHGADWWEFHPKAHVPSLPSRHDKIMEGYVGVQPTLSDWKSEVISVRLIAHNINTPSKT